MESITKFLESFLQSGQTETGFLYYAAAIGVAYVGGLVSSLTPCIYPMIPITVSVVGGLPANRETKRHWKNLLIRVLAYILGMAVIYSFLGVLAGLTGKLFGSLTNTPGWYIALALIFHLTALMMMDIIPFDPTIWWEKFKAIFTKKHHRPVPEHQHDKEVTLFGSFFLGLSSGFIAAPCTTPVLTAILAFIAQTQSVFLGFTLMFTFALGLGSLLLIIAIFTGALSSLPRSGQWMNTIKVLSGIVLLLLGDYLIYKAGGLGGAP